MPDRYRENADRELVEKQAEQIEESIAAQRRIVDGLEATGKDATDSRGFLAVLLRCRNLRRAKASSFARGKARKTRS